MTDSRRRITPGSGGSLPASIPHPRRVEVSCHACIRFVERYLDADLVADLRLRLHDEWRILRVLDQRYHLEITAFRGQIGATIAKLRSHAGTARLPARYTLMSGTARIRVVEDVAVTTLPSARRSRVRRPRLDVEARERLRAERDRRFNRVLA